ncbi:DUF488 domain-containing protein [Pedobacter montanisoli]|uniref:DUF488 family protein n=1 Tax=Pedobacter montanisoli TaxID=2923277 RepID=A0ABS9ZVS5_9SPHI|nr:DUF488 family protein [Pedobacter montanisoli]MCJ0742409.1 DUF488 family protein [Pedobacter montanisoli]
MYRAKIKRVYDKPEKTDGYRMLVDRLWPRGIKKEDAHLDEWNKELCPSTALRKAFNHKEELFEMFALRYREELTGKEEELHRVKAILDHQNLTLIYAAKDPKINHAIILLDVLKNVK